jgi:hypothetical protein
MWSRAGRALIVVGLAIGYWAGSAGDCAAQGVESLGVRALGMGGAFVAVADDATATYWNPAGLATGVIVSAVIEHGRQETGEPDAPAFLTSQRGSGTFVGLALPPLGISYYRIRSTRMLRPGDLGNGLVATRPLLPGDHGTAASLVTQHVGVTLVQSIGPVIDVAGTIKYVHGRAAVGNRDATLEGRDAFDRAADLPSVGSNAFDADLGVMAHAGQLRLGLVARNLTEPAFAVPTLISSGVQVEPLQLDRQVRAGAAWQFARSATTLSADVDLTRTVTALDVRRHVAVGAEHLISPRLAVRGGFRVNTVDDARPTGAAGVSVAVRSIWLDAQITRGGRLADRAWGLSARMGF